MPGINAFALWWLQVAIDRTSLLRIVSHIYRYLIIEPFDSDAVEFGLIEYGETRCHAMTLSAVYCFYHTGSAYK